jgi:hypothetical protein
MCKVNTSMSSCHYLPELQSNAIQRDEISTSEIPSSHLELWSEQCNPFSSLTSTLSTILKGNM